MAEKATSQGQPKPQLWSEPAQEPPKIQRHTTQEMHRGYDVKIKMLKSMRRSWRMSAHCLNG
eukprot:2787673-Amphidinium_carterae.1